MEKKKSKRAGVKGLRLVPGEIGLQSDLTIAEGIPVLGFKDLHT